MSSSPDTPIIIGPDLQQVSAGAILVTPAGASQQTLASALAPPTQLLQVATRSLMPNNNVAASPGLWQMTASAHWARSRIVSPTVLFGNFYISGANEAILGAGTIKASIEYPIGGALTLSNENIAAVNGAVTFPVGITSLHFNVTIPRGAKFGVRTLQQNANGVVFHQFQSVYCADPYDGWEEGTGAVSDKTTSGTVTPNVITYMPVAILAQTQDPGFLVVGDSRQEGGTEGVNDNTSDIGIIPRGVGRTNGYISLAISGTTLAQYLAGTRTYRDTLFQYVTHVVNAYGINDLAGSGTVAALAANAATFAALYPNNIVIGTTLPPQNQSTDGWLTLANQSLGPVEPKVLVYNNLVRAGITGQPFYWDIADAIDPFRLGQWPVTPNKAATTWTPTAQFTASLSGTTLTVSAIASGTLSLYAPIVSDQTTWVSGDMQPGQFIVAQLTGSAGSTGNYTVSKADTLTGRTMWVGGWGTNDGLHQTAALSVQIRDGGEIDLSLVRR